MHTTDAHALQAILQVVNDPGSGNSLQARWQKALDTKHRSVDFIAKHGEVVALLNESIRQVKALPANRQANYQPSIVHWWTAALAPDHSWSSENKAPLIGNEHIALLGSLGDVVEARLETTAAAPGGFNLEKVREECAAWIEQVRETPLPHNLASLLEQGLQHLVWLIDNADTFGIARVARAAEDVTGQLVMARSQVPEQSRPGWSARFRQWTGALVAFSAFNVAAHAAIESAEVLIDDIQPGVSYVIEMLDEEEGAPDKSPSS